MVVSSIKDSVSDAVSSAKDAVSDVASAGKSVASGIGDGISKVFEHDIFEDLGISKLVDGAMDIVTGQRSLGSLASSALDSLGLPDWAADMAGVAVDVMTGNKKGAIQQGLEAARGVADAAGIDRAADFLDTAGDVVGMANGSISSAGDFKAIAQETVASAASGNVQDGLVSGVLGEAGLGALEDTAGVASDLAGYVESATDAVSAFRDGDVSALGGQVFETLGGSGETLSEIAGEFVDPDAMSGLGQTIGDGGQIMERALEQFGAAPEPGQLSTGALLERLGVTPDAAGGTAESIIDLARDINQMGPQTGPLGSAIFDASSGQSLVDDLRSIVQEQAADIDVEINVDSAVLDMASMARGCLDMASLSNSVSSEVADLLQQLGSMSNTGRVGDMIQVEVRV